jgi:hypothetical protein
MDFQPPAQLAGGFFFAGARRWARMNIEMPASDKIADFVNSVVAIIGTIDTMEIVGQLHTLWQPPVVP